jgi:hypothetical protein
MPLAFQSLSHGEIAFGFFNIETDMAILNQYFFFASDFCALISDIAAAEQGPVDAALDAYVIGEEARGNLMGAIHGIDLHGFIGETYKLYPFPREQSAFKQNPQGYETRQIIEEIAVRYGEPSSMPFRGEPSSASITIAEYVFTRRWFHELLQYVWMGGYPRWKDGVRPSYVLSMKKAIEQSRHPLFGLNFDI